MKLTTILLSSAIAVSSAVALASSNNQEYRIHYFQDCALVKSVVMNKEQIQAYQKLNADSQKMDTFSQSIRDIEPDIDYYTDKIESLTAQAVIEDDYQVLVNKDMLAQQQAVVEEFEHFMQQHEGKFDKLEAQADLIEASAKRFEQLIEADINSTEYNQVRILAPGKQQQRECHSEIVSA